MENLIDLVVGDMERSLEITKDVYDKKSPTWDDFNELRNTMLQCCEVLQTRPLNYKPQSYVKNTF